MSEREFWCYCGLGFRTVRALGEHQQDDHKPAPRPAVQDHNRQAGGV